MPIGNSVRTREQIGEGTESLRSCEKIGNGTDSLTVAVRLRYRAASVSDH
jgi:hypothetical protein